MSDIYDDDAFSFVAKEFERRVRPSEELTPLQQHHVVHCARLLDIRSALDNGSGRHSWHPSLDNDPHQDWRRWLEGCGVPFNEPTGRLPEGEDCDAVLRPAERIEEWYARLSGDAWGALVVPTDLEPLTEANAGRRERWARAGTPLLAQ